MPRVSSYLQRFASCSFLLVLGLRNSLIIYCWGTTALSPSSNWAAFSTILTGSMLYITDMIKFRSCQTTNLLIQLNCCSLRFSQWSPMTRLTADPAVQLPLRSLQVPLLGAIFADPLLSRFLLISFGCKISAARMTHPTASGPPPP